MIVGFQQRGGVADHFKPGQFPLPFIPEKISASEIPASFVNVLVNRNDWYLDAQAVAACRAIRERLPQARIITYGSSMGAFAAINLAGHLDADEIIAISPLSTIFAPFAKQIDDRRFVADQPGLDRSLDLIGTGALMDRKGLLFFDPLHRLDSQHAARIASLTRMTLVAAPGSGHPAGRMVNEVCALRSILHAAASGTLDVLAIRQALLAAADAGGMVSGESWLADYVAAAEVSPAPLEPEDLRQRMARLLNDIATLTETRDASVALLKRLALVVTSRPQMRGHQAGLMQICVILFRMGAKQAARDLATAHLPPDRAARFAGR